MPHCFCSKNKKLTNLKRKSETQKHQEQSTRQLTKNTPTVVYLLTRQWANCSIFMHANSSSENKWTRLYTLTWLKLWGNGMWKKQAVQKQEV